MDTKAKLQVKKI